MADAFPSRVQSKDRCTAARSFRHPAFRGAIGCSSAHVGERSQQDVLFFARLERPMIGWSPQKHYWKNLSPRLAGLFGAVSSRCPEAFRGL